MQTVCSFFYQHDHTANVNWNCRSSYAVKWVICQFVVSTWWRLQMETIFALLAFCAWNSPVTGEFPPEMPVTRSFDVFFELRLQKRLSKQSRGWWFEMPSRSLWRHAVFIQWFVYHIATPILLSIFPQPYIVLVHIVPSINWTWNNQTISIACLDRLI